jgi:cold shock CspA family protein
MSERSKGVIRTWHLERFFGFISRVDERDLFYHGSAVVDGVELEIGDSVEFDVVPDAKSGRDKAVNVRLMEAA